MKRHPSLCRATLLGMRGSVGSSTLVCLFAFSVLRCSDGQANAEDTLSAISYGGGRCGKLVGGQQVPCSGQNFEAFSGSACALGRNYLHPLVAETLVDAYAELRDSHPDRTWQYGDLGRKDGGPLWPHKTHQNGRAADFFFPVTGADGAPAKLPIGPTNKLGYGHDFAPDGKLGSMRVDWTAIADHLGALERAGRQRGVSIQRVILAPPLRKTLLQEVPRLRRLRGKFNKKPAWVVHDEHYHVVFDIPANRKAPLQCD